MKCIVGLGNPGRKYEKTRHNIGFMVIDEFIRRNHWGPLKKNKFNGEHSEEYVNGEKVIVLKPLTFMNLSGKAVQAISHFYQINPSDILVVYDDLDMPAGRIRLRQQGGHGGHNGIRNIIEHLGTKEFKRIRVGIGRPEDTTPIIDYVLSPFSNKEKENIQNSIEKSVEACEAWLEKPFSDVMNEFNK